MKNMKFRWKGIYVAAGSRRGFPLTDTPLGVRHLPHMVWGRGRRAHNKIRLIARTPIDLDRAQQDRVDIEHEPLSSA